MTVKKNRFSGRQKLAYRVLVNVTAKGILCKNLKKCFERSMKMKIYRNYCILLCNFAALLNMDLVSRGKSLIRKSCICEAFFVRLRNSNKTLFPGQDWKECMTAMGFFSLTKPTNAHYSKNILTINFSREIKVVNS